MSLETSVDSQTTDVTGFFFSLAQPWFCPFKPFERIDLLILWHFEHFIVVFQRTFLELVCEPLDDRIYFSFNSDIDLVNYKCIATV